MAVIAMCFASSFLIVFSISFHLGMWMLNEPISTNYLDEILFFPLKFVMTIT